MAINYKNGKIYKIEPREDHCEGDIYIGSTTKQYLSQRMVQHRGDYMRFKNGIHNKTNSFDLFDKYGVDNCDIILLESVEAESKDELTAREAHYIRTIKCVNKIIPLRTDKEYRKDNRDKIKQYRSDNKEKIFEYTKQYRLDNKDKLCVCNKQYRENNKEKISELKKQNYQTNKDAILQKGKEKFTCECGSIVRSDNRSRHQKSLKHLKYLATSDDSESTSSGSGNICVA